MTAWMYRFLLIGLAFFSFTPGARHDQDAPRTLNIHVRDYCDPITFAAIGCDRIATPTSAGFLTFAGFQAELAAEKSVGAWRFIPDRAANAEDGLSVMLQNLGGETHTFTRVKQFGGGFVAALNAPSGTPVPAPECARMVNGQLVPQPPGPDNVFIPGNSDATGPQLREGEAAKFQCCIHPWMRVTIGAKDHRDKDADHD